MKAGDLFHIPPAELERVKGRPLVLSISGGKDSGACALLLEANGLSFSMVFMDTGWEHPAVPEYISSVIEPRFGPVTTLRSEEYPGGMVDLIRGKGIFPGRTVRFCTEFLKWRPFKRFIDGVDGDPVNVIGVRRGESRARARAERFAFDTALDVDVWRPLAEHSYDDVIEMHRAAGLPPNPLYLAGASRVGCFPCIFARKAEIQLMARLYPQRVDEIAALEREMTGAFQERAAQEASARSRLRDKAADRVAFTITKDKHGTKWTAWKRRDLTPPEAETAASARDAIGAGIHADAVDDEAARMSRRTFFHGRTDAPIAEVVEWAQTDRGGRQFQLFDASAKDGCMRWGMCDTAPEDGALVVIADPG